MLGRQARLELRPLKNGVLTVATLGLRDAATETIGTADEVDEVAAKLCPGVGSYGGAFCSFPNVPTAERPKVGGR